MLRPQNLYIIFSLILFSSCAQSKIKLADDYDIDLKVKRLEDYFSKSFNRVDEIKYQILFFEEFPSDFIEFENLYGYSDTTEGKLYESANDHLELFNQLSCIPDSIYYEKIISIGIDGHWDADGVNFFQKGLREHVLKNPELTFQLLEKRSNKEIFSFWIFFFDGTVFPEPIPNELKEFRVKYSRYYALLEEAYKNILQREKEE